jgi:hypothetical protein
MGFGFTGVSISKDGVVIGPDVPDLERKASEDILQEVQRVRCRAFLVKFGEFNPGRVVLSGVLNKAPGSVAAQQLYIYL